MFKNSGEKWEGKCIFRTGESFSFSLWNQNEMKDGEGKVMEYMMGLNFEMGFWRDRRMSNEGLEMDFSREEIKGEEEEEGMWSEK